MKRFHTHIGSRDAALEQRPEVFKAVGVYATAYILAGVVNHLMRVFSCETFIGLEGIGVERSASSDMPAYFFLQHSFATAGNYTGANLSATFRDTHNRSLVFRASTSDTALALANVHVPSLAADEGFVYFYFAAVSAQLGAEELILHCKANPLQHEPSRLLANFHVTGNLVATYAVLAISQHPSCGEPLVERNRTILIDRADLNRKFPLRVMASAFPSAPLCVEAGFGRAATGADHAVRPSTNSNVVDAVVRIREVDNWFLKACRLFAHVVPHRSQYSKKRWASQ